MRLKCGEERQGENGLESPEAARMIVLSELVNEGSSRTYGAGFDNHICFLLVTADQCCAAQSAALIPFRTPLPHVEGPALSVVFGGMPVLASSPTSKIILCRRLPRDTWQ
jgi:hypothetical protein